MIMPRMTIKVLKTDWVIESFFIGWSIDFKFGLDQSHHNLKKNNNTIANMRYLYTNISKIMPAPAKPESSGITGFDNEAYLKEQTASILERVERFHDKLYLEFGGKIMFDYHATPT
jgi:hypothetical protein